MRVNNNIHCCKMLVRCLFLLVWWLQKVSTAGILFPQQSETRELFVLDGLWNFRAANVSNQDQGFSEGWYLKRLDQTGDVISMPVPSSYNDVTQSAALRDHIGWVWYDRQFFVSKQWRTNNVYVRFGSANYFTSVWVNGIHVTNHSGGYLPFQGDITSLLFYGQLNRITVAINNTLTPWTIPQGTIQYFLDSSKYPPGYHVQKYNFDFMNYAGIHRPVVLYSVPPTFIDDIVVNTRLPDQNTGLVTYSVSVTGSNPHTVSINLYDAQQLLVATTSGAVGQLQVNQPHLWWPRGMNQQVGYLYTLEVQLKDQSTQELIDTYRLRIGMREIRWDNNGVYVNNRSVYFKGFGRHEDSILRGRGLDLVTLIKDFNLMAWTEANSFRTSHYPYSEELMDLADQQGFMVIDEVPAVALDTFDEPLLQAHLQTIEELFNRDKNRPSVVMWSVGNEPQSQQLAASSYFNATATRVRQLDNMRPVTLVLNKDHLVDLAGQFFDVTCINRYYSWYSDTGHLELVSYQLINDVTAWKNKYGKPVMVTEYGADTVPGLHMDPAFVWTEDYQVEMMTEYFKAFDDLYNKGYLIGEMIWNFADFATPQGTTRVVVNRKGIFTRERQPKASARHLKERYGKLNR